MPAEIKLTQKHLDYVLKRHNQGFGARVISKELDVTRYLVMKAYKVLNLDVSDKNTRKIKDIPLEKTCIKCNDLKKIECFRKRHRNNKNNVYEFYESYCLSCEKQFNKTRRTEKRLYSASYRSNNKNKISKNRRSRYKNDVCYRLKSSISSAIYDGLKSNNSSKNGKSCITFLPYTIDELKSHLEFQFEPWMTWENWGRYEVKKWNDDDQSTWTWQIDHIVPASKFTYNGVSDESFLECWSLNNLRPYSAKQNIIDRDLR